jgi:hypothetical protein
MSRIAQFRFQGWFLSIFTPACRRGVTSLCLLLATPWVQADVPENDSYRLPLALGDQAVSITGTNAKATNGLYEDGFHGVWYQWSPGETGAFEVTTEGSSFDTRLVLYVMTTGSFGGLSWWDDNDDQGDLTSSRLIRIFFEGVDYRILVSSKFEDQKGPFNLNILELPTPENDTAEGAIILTGSIAQVSGENPAASGGPQENGELGMWYRWTAPTSGSYRISTEGSDYSTRLTLLTGSGPGNLNEIAYNDDDPNGSFGASRIDLEASEGTSYWIVVSTYHTTETGSHQLTISPPAPNDDPATAIEVFGNSFSESGNNVGAAGGDNESSGSQGIWYRWTPAQDGAFTVTTAGSDFDTYMNLYVGPDSNNIESLAYGRRDQVGERISSRIDFIAIGGSTYWFLVGSDEKGKTGNVQISLEGLPIADNDTAATAAGLQGESVSERGSVTSGTTNSGERGFYGVWYKWTATQSGLYSFTTANSSFDTFLTLYTGSGPGSLSEVAFNDESPENPGGNFRGISSFAYTVTSGTQYWVLVSAASETEFGVFRLRILPVPPNDKVADAILLTGDDPVLESDNIGALGEEGERGVHSVWYRWIAPDSRDYAFTTEGSDFDTVMTIFSGPNASNLEEVGWNDNGSLVPSLFLTTSYLMLPVTEGTVYWIQISARFEGQTGFIRMSLIPGSIPQTLAEWLQSELLDFGISTLNGAFDDYDKDGFVHLVEFAFGMNPRVKDRTVPIVPIQSGFSGDMLFKFPRRKASTDPSLTYEPEFFSFGSGWTTEVDRTTVDSIDSVWEEVLVRQPASISGIFRGGRVKVTYSAQ